MPLGLEKVGGGGHETFWSYNCYKKKKLVNMLEFVNYQLTS